VIPPPIKTGLSYKREKDNDDDELDKIMDDILKNDNSKKKGKPIDTPLDYLVSY
jgi:hypothetical protein